MADRKVGRASLPAIPKPSGVLRTRMLAALAAAVVVFFVGRELAPGFFLFSFGSSQQAVSQPLPEFPSDPDRWLNSPPLKVAGLKGQVVFLEVWTFG